MTAARYRRQIPRVIHLPWFRVKVRQVTARELAVVVDGDTSCEGAWDHDAMTIYLKRSLPVRRKRNALYHELQHALTDLKDWAIETGISR